MAELARIGGAAAPSRPDISAFHPFLRLARLLDGLEPGRSPLPGGAPVALQVGEPQRAPPELLAGALAEAADGWGRYPPPRGTEDFRRACADWLARRYALPAGMVDPERHLLPLPGSREGLFFAALALVGPGRDKVLLPNPFYHVYAGAAVAAGAEPVFVPARRADGFQPDYASLDPRLLDRAALAYVCTPSNPTGAVAGVERLQDLVRLARRHGFAACVDECYAEIYDAEPPPGVLQAAAHLGGGLEGVLAFHSLSKRSSAAGLRCGFVAGAADLVDRLDQALRVGGAGVPLPTLAAGARLWREEAHVEANRAHYRANFAAAERALGASRLGAAGAARPQAGFFLWLEVGDGEAAARALWREAGIKVLPGAYMGADAGDGGGNPGAAYIRVALVFEPEVTEPALARLAAVLG